MVGALDRLAPGVALAENVTAVPADVEEAAKLAVPGARQHDREGARVGDGQLARLGDLVEARCVLPGAREDPLLLETEHGRIAVPVVRQRAREGGRRHRPNLPPDRADLLAGRRG